MDLPHCACVPVETAGGGRTFSEAFERPFARIRELEGLAARSRRRIQALSRHVGSLERKSESERVEARDLEIELRNVAHHWYLEAERLRLQQESWSVRHALAARAAVSRALPAGSRRGRLLAALLRRG